MTERGIALGQELGLGPAERDALVARARDAGYSSAWTNARETREPFDACARWTRGRMTAGISVVPLDAWDISALGRVAAETARTATGFVLGVGSGRAGRGALELVRAGVAALRREAPGIPIYIGALGPRMLRLAGEVADGAALNWCDSERVAWSRDRVAEGARGAGRDPKAVRVVEYIRVCVDDDPEAARVALAVAMLGYALAGPRRPKDSGYRIHFTRMGFDEVLTDLEARRERGEPLEALAADVPAELVGKVGAFGRPAEAAASFARLGEGLDLPIVRVVAARDPQTSARAVIDACAPGGTR
ncbi:MAG TPA: LLM class flavin-dependent oxidoreductase [Candidatus Limnocylindria bacterium]|nr:LLM class flavin-dependent oxidoreductase [Candidatus Limnocylindria bacterium]